mgnify:CR=1
ATFEDRAAVAAEVNAGKARPHAAASLRPAQMHSMDVDERAAIAAETDAVVTTFA